MPNADRAAVAREVLTELALSHHDKGFTVVVDLIESWRDEHYPAPPAPETVTVTNTWTQQPSGYFTDRIGNATPYSDEWALALQSIASGARVLKERDARIAELGQLLRDQPRLLYDSAWQAIDRMGRAVGAMTGPGSNCHVTAKRVCKTIETLKAERDAASSLLAELQRQGAVIVGDCLAAQHARRKAEAERDAALRALEDWKQAALTLGESLGASGPVGYYAMRPVEWLEWARAVVKGEGSSSTTQALGEGQHEPNRQEPRGSTSVSSTAAPIPLGAVVEVEGEGGVESWVWDGKLWTSGGGVMPFEAVRWRALMLTALYRARHPVATRETVERVYDVISRNESGGRLFWWGKAKAALRAAGVTVQEGA